MRGQAQVWVAATAGVALVAGVVVFLAVHSLSEADSWSSIGGFLTALVTVVISTVAWVARRPDRTDEPGSKTGKGSRSWLNLFLGNQNVFYGDHQRNKVGNTDHKSEEPD